MVKHNGELLRSIIVVLKEADKSLSIREISSLVGWAPKSVRDEMRRLRESMISEWIIEEKQKNILHFSFEEIIKHVPTDFIVDFGKKTWVFGSPFQLQKVKLLNETLNKIKKMDKLND